ncbi:monofunctional biosynthetic peptidoglycan transglycosylase [Algoriphagus marincola]|uniref:monofunctional biosynthetic peptidoglycan transglycosylase n=1 Tax=Algoriphagus marincola TaxID=264027 RepID=UPI0003F6663D
MIRFLKRVGRSLLKLVLGFFVLSILSVFFFKFVPVPVTPLMLIRTFEQATDEKQSIKLSKDWVPASEISKHAFQAVYAAEDQNFLEHHGFDWKAMEKAWEQNKKGKRIKGASTISQQTAKNVFLWPARTYLRKGLEAYFTVLIELIWGKERTLEVYLNVIEMGPGIYGIEAAAQTYYGKPASELNRAEAAMIAAILPNPRKWSPKNPTNYLKSRQSWILKQMGNLNQLPVGK